MKKSNRAFTLVELLVVIGILSLLMTILLPTLGRAKDLTRETICLTRLGGQARAMYIYAGQYNDFLPIGPSDPMDPPMPPLPYNSIATNQLWIGSLSAYNGCGALMEDRIVSEEFFFCPADNSSDPKEELPNLRRRGDEDAYGSYLYRQLDQTGPAGIDPPTRLRLGRLGKNEDGKPVKALLMDLNSEMPGAPARTNHRGKRVNVAFAGGYAMGFDNMDKAFTLRKQDVTNPFGRLDEILIYADSLGQ